MSDVVIRVENLGKRYRIGERKHQLALRDVLTHAFSAQVRMFRPGTPASGNGDHSHIWALKNVSFEIRQGEVVGFVGRNGAGKSTLLKILARVTKPTCGFAEVRGRVGTLLEVGTGFHPELTGRENVFLSGSILGMRKTEIHRHFDEIIAFAEVEKFIDTPLKHYSTGMQMRLAFAVAAHLEPEILIVDEVLAVGDAAFQKKCMGKMGDAAREGRTVLFVSHNMAAVRSLSGRGYLVSQGRIAFSGAIDQCISHYLVSTDDMSSDIDTSDLPRPPDVAGDTALRITRITLNTSTGSAVAYSGEPLSVTMEFELTRPLDDLVFGYSVYSSDGVKIFECRSTDAYGVLAHLEPGRYSLQCTLPTNFLNQGLYSLHSGARCATKGLDHLPDLMTFRIESQERLESVWLQASAGLLQIRSHWTSPEPLAQVIAQDLRG